MLNSLFATIIALLLLWATSTIVGFSSRFSSITRAGWYPAIAGLRPATTTWLPRFVAIARAGWYTAIAWWLRFNRRAVISRAVSRPVSGVAAITNNRLPYAATVTSIPIMIIAVI